MFKNLAGARLGIFIFIGTVFLVLGIFLIGNKDALFQSTFRIKALFPTVEGLREGATVRLSGIDVGSVSDISIAGDTLGRVIVEMRIETKVKDFIRIDSRAAVETEGLVGNKIVVLSVGSSSSPIVQDGGYIKAKPPINVTQMIEEGQVTLSYVKNITKDFSEIVTKINNGEGTIGKIINDDELYKSSVEITETANKSLTSITNRLDEISKIVVAATGEFQQIVTGLDSMVNKIDYIVEDVRQGKGVIGALVSKKGNYADSVSAIVNNLVQTTQQVRVGASRFAENMEALKHNWLFKNYFEQRGYWDVSEYEKDIDGKITELKERTKALDDRIKELKQLQNTSERKASQ